MASSSVPSGTRLGIDANIFIYHFVQGNPEATALLRRMAVGDLEGVTTAEVLLETAHRLMIFEATSAGLISGNNPARRLRDKHEVAAGLHRYFEDVQTIRALGIKVLPVLKDPLGASHGIRRKHGLLINDSILAATLAANNVRHLATADQDFLRVEELEVHLIRT